MVRKRTFETTETFETTGTGDGGDDADAPAVFLADVSLNQVPDPNGKTTLEVSLGSDQPTSGWYIADLLGPDGTTETVAEFGGIDLDGDDPTGRSTIITAPDADSFEVRVKGGYETGE